MRVLVCGGRDYTNADNIARVLDGAHAEKSFSILIYGMARGADDLAKWWAIRRRIPLLGFRADWEHHGRKAGALRNQEMIDKGKPDLVVAFPGGKGTADMVARAKRAGVQVIEAPA